MGGVVRTAVIPVAGLGTRFLPATKAVPKEMIPIIDKPTIQYVVEEAVASGIDHIVFITGRNKTAIANHFDYHPELEHHLEKAGKFDELAAVRDPVSGARFSFVRQQEPKGLGHAVLCAKHLFREGESFAVLLGDDVIEGNPPALAQMVERYEQVRAPVIALQQVPRQDVSKYGIVGGREVKPGLYRLTELVEKPAVDEAPSDLAIIGRYILDWRVFGYIEETGAGALGEIQLTDALRRYDEMYGYRFTGTRYDAGNKFDYIRATIELALARDEFREPLIRYLRQLEL